MSTKQTRASFPCFRWQEQLGTYAQRNAKVNDHVLTALDIYVQLFLMCLPVDLCKRNRRKRGVVAREAQKHGAFMMAWASHPCSQAMRIFHIGAKKKWRRKLVRTEVHPRFRGVRTFSRRCFLERIVKSQGRSRLVCAHAKGWHATIQAPCAVLWNVHRMDRF